MTAGAGVDTIVAPATPEGRSALAVVRIDGPRARIITEELSGRALSPRHATLVRLADGPETIDDAIVTWFQQPNSYTGNDLVEVSLHGSAYLVARLVRAARKRGARVAEPGEFTERALLNGKIDLVQAESIIDLIDSRTSLQAKLSLRNLEGELSRLAEGMRGRLLDVLSRLEAALDFSEEGYEFIERGEAIELLERLVDEVGTLGETFSRGIAVTQGLTAVILGRPNAGKSTLLNFVCGSDRAIVTEEPGTTRDLLRETVELGGLPVTFVDTAGIRSGAGRVEGIGIERARDAASTADLVLYLVDASTGLSTEDEDELARLRDPMVIWTKTDLRASPEGVLGVSVSKGDGVEGLLSTIDRVVRERWAPPEGSATIVNERQRGQIDDCETGLRAALEALRDGAQEEIVAVDLYRAANALGALTGAIGRDDIYREIFSRFCIGK
ncbi:MAG: tRNA uridine-5-carboxymethylaminomethyl(34) synthesis GTPase MnmE [Thermoanaerobaculia bacterium]